MEYVIIVRYSFVNNAMEHIVLIVLKDTTFYRVTVFKNVPWHIIIQMEIVNFVKSLNA